MSSRDKNQQAGYYLAPDPFHSDEDNLFAWSREVLQQGLTFLRQQSAYQFIQPAMDAVGGVEDLSTGSLSNANEEPTLRNAKELIAAQTNIRVIPNFSTEIDAFKMQQEVLNKCYMGWQSATFADRSVRKVWQYSVIQGTGYSFTRYDPHYWSRGRGDIVVDALGALDVLPVGMPSDHNLQRAYCVAIKVKTPYHEVLRRFPRYADKIKPNNEENKVLGGIIPQAVRFASAALRRFGPGNLQEKEPVSWATVDLYYLFIDDTSINNTGSPIPMGDPGTNYAYTVPSIGQDIPVGMDLQGRPIMRKATEDDARLYPTRRMLICTDTCCLNPDYQLQVSPSWYPGVPVSQFTADDWAWNFLGFSLMRAGKNLETVNNQVLRAIVDALNVRLSPPIAYNRSTVSDALAQTMNPRLPHQKIGLDMTLAGDKQFVPWLPSEYYSVPPYAPVLIQENEGRIKFQMGVGDATALARAKQLPAGDSVERLMEAMGPLVKDQSRNMEASIRMLGEQWKYLFFQHYSAPRRFQLLGDNGLTEEDYNYDPGNLLPDGEPGDYYTRARRHVPNFQFRVHPYSLHEITSVTRRLFYLQLQRSGFPIDWWTLAEVFDIKNFGPAPKIEDPSTGERREASTVMEKWLAQKEMEAKMQAASGGAQQGGRGKGRPPSGQTPPQMATKAGGRPVVRESPK